MDTKLIAGERVSGSWIERARQRPLGPDVLAKPALVLDPFTGAGTTGLAAVKHGRDFLGVELNVDYIAMAEARARRLYPLFVSE
ncbi:hypothetical protein EPO44_10255 [bacterium]|nr:MAG: hypothetical protein EPO44_10255 [bacterium]